MAANGNGNSVKGFLLKTFEILLVPAIVGFFAWYGTTLSMKQTLDTVVEVQKAVVAKVALLSDWMVASKAVEAARDQILKDIRDDQIRRYRKE